MNAILDRLRTIGPGKAANWIMVLFLLVALGGFLRFAMPEVYALGLTAIAGNDALFVELPGE